MYVLIFFMTNWVLVVVSQVAGAAKKILNYIAGLSLPSAEDKVTQNLKVITQHILLLLEGSVFR